MNSKKNVSFNQIIRITLYFFLSSVSYLLLNISFLSYISMQILLLVVYLIMFVFEFKSAGYRFFALPPAVFMFYSLINNFVSGIYFFKYGIGNISSFNEASEVIVKGTWYTLVATQILWISFYFIPEFNFKFFKKPEIKGVSRSLILILVGISLSAFIIGIKLGVYGYVADVEKVNITSYIRFAVNLGYLAIIFLAVYSYEDPFSRKLLYGLVVLYFFIGIAFGSKSTGVLPIMFLVISLYMTKRKIKTYYIIMIVLFIFLSYLLVEPFRMYYAYKGEDYNTQNIAEFAQLFVDSYKATDSGEKTNYGMNFLERQSYVVPLAMTIQYADKNNYYASEEWKNFMLSPLYAIIPRFIWESKPLANFGSWASVNIFDFPETTSTGITPQGYAYLVARFAGIIIFFFFAGSIQKIIFNTFYLNTEYIPFYILMYFDIGYPAVLPWTFVAGTIQSVIFMLPVIMVLTYTKMGLTSPIEYNEI